jgi:hypothetical protein
MRLRLSEEGVQIVERSPEDAYAVVEDPDGNRIAFERYLR